MKAISTLESASTPAAAPARGPRGPAAAFALLLLGLPSVAAAQDIERVKTLYVAAAYEEALAAMPPDLTGKARTDLEQYRALCLLALGREDEAVTTIERLVKDHPTYLPSESDTSPRMLTIFSEVRGKLVPDVARQISTEAKDQFDAKNEEGAQAGFKRTLEVIDSLPEADREKLADLRMLADGFLDLTAAKPAASARSEAPAAEAPTASEEYVGPVPIREQLPVWNPPDSAAMQTEYVGLLHVVISEEGRVVAATVMKRTHPLYDAAVMRSAKEWTYKPATRGGRPIPSQKSIQIRLIPR